MPRWLTKISDVFCGVRSTRARYLSISPVEYTESRTRPSVRRMMSCGSFARFSAHAVSRMPVAASDFSTCMPIVGQKSTSTGHTRSGGRFTASQRWLPWRSIFATTPPGTTAEVAAAGAAPATGRPACGWPDAVIVCGRSGTRKRSSRGSCDRSGGTSSGVRDCWAVSYCDLVGLEEAAAPGTAGQQRGTDDSQPAQTGETIHHRSSCQG